MFPEISTNFSKLGRFYSECLLKHAAIVAIFKRVQLEKKHHFSQIHFKPWSFNGGIPLSCSQKYPIALPQMSGATCHHSKGFGSHFGWSELDMKKSILSRIPTWKKNTHKTQESKIFGFKLQIKKKVERRNAKLVKVSVVIFHRNDRFVSFHSCLEDGGESDGNFDERLRNAKNLLLSWGSGPYLMLGLKQPVWYISGWLFFTNPSEKYAQVKLDHFPKGWKEIYFKPPASFVYCT